MEQKVTISNAYHSSSQKSLLKLVLQGCGECVVCNPEIAIKKIANFALPGTNGRGGI